MDLPATEKKTPCGHTTPKSFAAGDVVLSCEPWVCAFKYEHYKDMCAYCFKISDKDLKLMMCSGCELHYYCGNDCQAADWKRDHKSEYKMLKVMNSNIRQLNPNVDYDKDYVGEFGFCPAEILMAKIVNKIKSGKKEQLADFDGEFNARDILEMLPYDPNYEKMFEIQDHTLLPSIWPTTTLGNPPAGFHQMVRLVCYNTFPIRDQTGKESLIAAGLFPQALHRRMTPVCWGINVTMDMQRRTLVVRAAEDIAHYTGFKDLRQNEISINIFATTLKERRWWAKLWYFGPCTCSKCTQEYDAEINPLKCLTIGCPRRIPSDLRALQPCHQCGAVNLQRLIQLVVLMDRNMAIDDEGRDILLLGKRRYGLLLELDRADIVHPDAQFRYVLGNQSLYYLVNEKRYEEAWKLCPAMVACVRAIYPAFHLGRARFIFRAAEIPCKWYFKGGREGGRARWKEILGAGILEWLWEAHKIYRKLSGPDYRMERHLTLTMKVVGHIYNDLLSDGVNLVDLRDLPALREVVLSTFASK